MITFEEAQNALTDIADNIPAEIYNGLNGGIILVPEEKLHPQAVDGNLFILGEYHYDPNGFGRYITLYYGSICRAHGYLTPEDQVKKLEALLYHELTHHLEHRAGDRSLEIQDAVDIAKYRREAEKSQPQ